MELQGRFGGYSRFVAEGGARITRPSHRAYSRPAQIGLGVGASQSRIARIAGLDERTFSPFHTRPDRERRLSRFSIQPRLANLSRRDRDPHKHAADAGSVYW